MSSSRPFVRSIQLAVATAIAGAIFGGAPRLGGGPRRSRRPPSAAGDRGIRRPRPVRRRHARLRVPRDLRDPGPRHGVPHGHPAPRPPLGRVVALQPRRPGRRLHLLPDPADADRLPAVARRAPPGVVRRVVEPRRQSPGRSGDASAGRSSHRPSWARSCCSSRTRSPPTRRPRRSSARAVRSSRSRSPDKMQSEVVLGPGECRQGAGARDDPGRLAGDGCSTRSSSGAPRGGSDDRHAGPRARGARRREAARCIARPTGAVAGGHVGMSRHGLAILVIVLGYLVLPLFAMLEFSTRGNYGSRSLDSYAAIFSDQNLIDGITNVARDRGPDGRRHAPAARARRWSGRSCASRACAR